MLINIVDIGTPNTKTTKNGRTYQEIEVTYKGETGQVNNKKLVSFSNPAVFNHIKALAKGDQVDVVTTKDTAGYWQWTGIGNGETKVAETKTTASSGTRVTGSNYETKEERAQRQVYIIRQSSIANAISLLGQSSDVNNVLQVAKQFEDYIFATNAQEEVKEPTLDDLMDDVPL